jgi:hypothetical protein
MINCIKKERTGKKKKRKKFTKKRKQHVRMIKWKKVT